MDAVEVRDGGGLAECVVVPDREEADCQTGDSQQVGLNLFPSAESKMALQGAPTLHCVELDSEVGWLGQGGRRLLPGGHLSPGHIATCSPFRFAG